LIGHELESTLAVQSRDMLSGHVVLNAKIAKATDLPGDRIPVVFQEVLRFLHLISLSGERLTPSRIVDDAWHEFILCTRLYADYCQAQFGRFIHHHPGGDETVNRKQFRRTIELYRQYFGPPDPAIWGEGVQDADACGSCESGVNL
jgi:hypothetical protein